MDSTRRFTLPDLISICPFEQAFNPHFEQAAAESSAWTHSFNVFRDRKRAFFKQSSAKMLVAFAYPYASYKELQTCYDFMNLLFVIDEVTDDQDRAGAQETMEKHLHILRGERGDDSAVSIMSREFKARFDKRATPVCQRRFARLCEEYIDSVIREAELRERGETLRVGEYRVLRRSNSAVDYCFGMFEYILDLDIPDEAMDSSVLRRMRGAAVDMVTDYVGNEWKTLLDGFITDEARLPSWGPRVDASVRSYVSAMKTDGLDVKRTLSVTLKKCELEAYAC